MIKNKCLVCGSFDFRADRALSGRLICISCGNPYGFSRISKDNLNNNSFSIKRKNLLFIILLILVFILIIS